MRRLILLAALLPALLAGSAHAEAGPFTWDGATWCPAFQTWYGCTGAVTPHYYTAEFAPGQVSADGPDLDLSMNAAATESGSATSQDTSPIGSVLSEQITLPCNAAGQIENWPAFWADHTVGAWPLNGEIDIMEGLGGRASASVHYQDAAGAAKVITIYPPGDWCGTHLYSATRDSTAVTFTWDGQQVGQVTTAEMGVPMFTDPLRVINDYGAGKWGGPVAGGVSMIIAPEY